MVLDCCPDSSSLALRATIFTVALLHHQPLQAASLIGCCSPAWEKKDQMSSPRFKIININHV